VRRRRLGIELRRLREDAGLTLERVAESLECSTSKISRIEIGQVSVAPRDVRDMLELYGISGQQRDALIQIARDARQKGWWQAYDDVPAVPLVGLVLQP
jgi:transcriptional regulator with XRE-family HTH domain